MIHTVNDHRGNPPKVSMVDTRPACFPVDRSTAEVEEDRREDDGDLEVTESGMTGILSEGVSKQGPNTSEQFKNLELECQ
jgi:hypothetical protein